MKRKGKWGFFKHEVIVDENNDPYIKRWRLIETPWFGVFIHNILRSDTDRDLHDHPWDFVTFLLKGYYDESSLRMNNDITYGNTKRFFAPCMIRHRAEDFHRVTLERPVWTLFITGPKRKHWGFLTENGWVHNKSYNDNKHIRTV